MIKRFHALYVGQIDLDNVGLDGTPADQRRYSNQRLSEVFMTTRDVARLMDELGYHALWTAEHHFQHEGYEVLPNLILFGQHLAMLTEGLRLGQMFNVVPQWHPLRLAEDFAIADILTGGRMEFGVGRGTVPRDMDRLSWDDWMDAAVAAYDALAVGHDAVIVGGLSAGGTMALDLALRRPPRALLLYSAAISASICFD